MVLKQLVTVNIPVNQTMDYALIGILIQVRTSDIYELHKVRCTAERTTVDFFKE